MRLIRKFIADINASNYGVLLVIAIIVVVGGALNFSINQMVNNRPRERTFIDFQEITDNEYRVLSASPHDIDWSQIKTTVDGSIFDHGKTGPIQAGDTINLPSGEEACIIHIPTNTIIAKLELI